MLISFIIPVYNVERYLSVCIESILNQGIEHSSFEIILIEDCSMDNSLQICREYCLRYDNITLIENESNLGPGLSRNKGISQSKGKYLHFMDSDDLLLPNALESLISMDVFSSSPDIIQFEISENHKLRTSQNEILFNGNLLESSLSFKNLAAWCFFIRRCFIIDNNITFSERKIGEDAIFTISAISKNPSIIIVSNVIYYYRNNPVSISSKTDISYINCLFEVADKIQTILSGSKLSGVYVSLVLKGIISKFYKSQRTLQECVRFKRKMKAFKQ